MHTGPVYGTAALRCLIIIVRIQKFEQPSCGVTVYLNWETFDNYRCVSGSNTSVTYTRVASHLACSDTPGITYIVARLSRSDTPRRSDQWQGSTRVSGEHRWLAVTPHAAPTNGKAPRS